MRVISELVSKRQGLKLRSVLQRISAEAVTTRQLHINSRLSIEKRRPLPTLVNSYSHSISTTPMTAATLGQVLDQSTELFPDRDFVVFSQTDERRTFQEFHREVENFAAGLLQLGIQKGDRVAIWGPNSLEWAITQFATAKIGAILVSINPAYQSGELKYAMRLVGCKALVSSATFYTQNYYEILRNVVPEITSCQAGNLVSQTLPDLRSVIIIDPQQKYDGTFKFQDVIRSGGPREVSKVHDIQKKLQCDDPINIQFTSGTTGHPKGATLTHHNIVNNAKFIGTRLGYDDQAQASLCCQVPLYHCFGMVGGMVSGAVLGLTIVFPTSMYDPRASVAAMAKEKCAIILGLPTMYMDVCNVAKQANVTFPELNTGVIAGSYCPPEVIEQASNQLGIDVYVSIHNRLV